MSTSTLRAGIVLLILSLGVQLPLPAHVAADAGRSRPDADRPAVTASTEQTPGLPRFADRPPADPFAWMTQDVHEPEAIGPFAPSCEPICYRHVLSPAFPRALWSITVGDLDGDLDADVVGVGLNYEGSFCVAMNDGDGGFATSTRYHVGHDPRRVVLADVDNDLDLDLITTDSLGGRVYVYFNPGNGAFGKPGGAYKFPDGVRPIDFAAADVDRDGDADLILGDGYGTLPVLLNRGDGTFEYGPSYRINAHGFLYDVLAEDLTGDGYPDLAVLTMPYEPPYVLHDRAFVAMLTNDGAGGFGHMQRFRTPDWPTLALAAADLDNDGDLDIGGVNSPNANPKPNGFWVMLNDGSGSMSEAIVYPVGPWPHDVAFDDLDGDGDMDAVVPNQRFHNENHPHDVSILFNRGDGSFEPECRYAVGERPGAVATADMNGDDRVDVVVANYSGDDYAEAVSILFNECP